MDATINTRWFNCPGDPKAVLVTSDAFKREYMFPNLSAAAYIRDSLASREEHLVAAKAACDFYIDN